ncbi:MAG: dicarboxylate/amino acid:cation symporter [Burkholderiales bacterium]|nr:dicarboxylate/amino acid:cation symporter [Burkholderiales bacterium]
MRIKLGFGNQCLLALVLGLVAGHFMPQNAVDIITPFGDAFLKLLKLIIIPLTFSTIVASFSKLDDIHLVQRLGTRTLIWFIITAIIAATIGVLIGKLFNPGLGLNLSLAASDYQPRTIPSISGTFLDMLPGNLIGQIAEGKVIPVIIFAIFFGLALTSMGEKANTVRNFFDEFSHVMFKITRKIIRLSPYGIFALLVPVGNEYGIATLLPLGKFIVAIYVACALQIIVYAILITVVAKRNPINFFKQFWPAMITAFTTSSSLGTLPVTLETLVDRVRISERVAGFVAPLGATMKMDGCGAIYPAIVCILTAQVFGIDLSLQQYILIIITAAIATIGTAGVPGTASIMATVVLASVGLPLQGLALVIGIDKIIDMMRTMTNVTGSGVCATIVDKTYQKHLAK